MQEISDQKSSTNHDYEIDFIELFKVLVRGKWTVISITSIFSIMGVIFSLSLPNIYASKALLASSITSSNPGIVQNYSSLANIAGIDLPKDSETNEAQAIEKLNSFSFFEDYFSPNIFLPDLMAFKSWDPVSNNLEYDSKIYNVDTSNWVRNFSYPQKLVPTAQESFAVFKNKHLFIEKDKKTNFVTIEIKHQSPYIAQEWIKIIIDQINGYYRKKDKNEAETASGYLNDILMKTNLSEVKQVIAKLLQQETQKLTLIEANEFYVYEYIDPPAVMERKSEPKRAFICILVSMLGGILGIFFVLARHFIFNSRKRLINKK